MTDDLRKIHPRRRRRKRKRSRHRKDAVAIAAIPLAPPNLRLATERLRLLNRHPDRASA